MCMIYQNYGVTLMSFSIPVKGIIKNKSIGCKVVDESSP